MSDINPNSVGEYVKDYDCLIEGVEYFLELQQQVAEQKDLKAIRNHYDEHPEDKLCHIYRPRSRHMALCRRSGIEAIDRMAIRLISEAPNGHDLSRKRIADLISHNVLQVAFDRVTDDKELVRVLKTYVSQSEADHVEASHQFPCVLFHCPPNHTDLAPPPPDQFSLGPVFFQRSQAFVGELCRAVQCGEKAADDKAVDLFSKSAEKCG